MPNDKLDNMFAKQEALMKRYAERDANFPVWPLTNTTSKQEQKFIHDTLINAVSEIFEADRALRNSKQHRETNIAEFDRENFVEEIVDCMKFLLEVLLLVGVTPTELNNAHDEKDAVCHQRLDTKY